MKTKAIPPVTSEDLREVRDRLSETQTQFAARMGINQGTISRWENGRLPEKGPVQALLRRVLQDIERVHPGTARHVSLA